MKRGVDQLNLGWETPKNLRVGLWGGQGKLIEVPKARECAIAQNSSFGKATFSKRKAGKDSETGRLSNENPPSRPEREGRGKGG